MGTFYGERLIFFSSIIMIEDCNRFGLVSVAVLISLNIVFPHIRNYKKGRAKTKLSLEHLRRKNIRKY